MLPAKALAVANIMAVAGRQGEGLLLHLAVATRAGGGSVGGRGVGGGVSRGRGRDDVVWGPRGSAVRQDTGDWMRGVVLGVAPSPLAGGNESAEVRHRTCELRRKRKKLSDGETGGEQSESLVREKKNKRPGLFFFFQGVHAACSLVGPAPRPSKLGVLDEVLLAPRQVLAPRAGLLRHLRRGLVVHSVKLFHHDVLASALGLVLELHHALHLGEQCVIVSHADVLARIELRPPLPHDDPARGHRLASVHLDPEPLAVGVSTVLRRTSSFLVRALHEEVAAALAP
mmetsp:Transcript_1222/g.3740  ORF Transcript_1222/g.3740 Transcript_1222/m.3740 type:complete len:285 (+) Transcript_1222:582-1436(+)